MIRATKETEAGRRYLDLQRKAKQTGRPTDELIQLYALEGFLDRLSRSAHADRFVLKGGVLLAALDARRPTRDIDLAAHDLENSAEHVLLLIQEIAAIAIDDGLTFDTEHATAETIRDDDHYSGVRITLGGELSRATVRLHVDINIGDPIWPEPQQVRLPLACMPSSLPRRNPWVHVSLASPEATAFREIQAGRLPHHPFRGLLDVHSRYGLHTRRATKVALCTEELFSRTPCTAAPIATGWSDSCPMGFAPTGRPCLCTAH